MDTSRFLFSFEGRINRAKCWQAGLVIVCGMMLLGVLTSVVERAFGHETLTFSISITDIFYALDPAAYRALPSADRVELFFKVLATPLLLWVYFATSIKRLHDRDKSGWWMVPFFVVPGLITQFSDRFDDYYFMLVLAFITSVLYAWGFVEIYCLKGSRKTNRFGYQPLTPRDTRPGWRQFDELEFVPRRAGPSPGSHVKRGA